MLKSADNPRLGSILFRDEEKYFEKDQNPDLVYQNKIAPAKSIVEKWYFDNKSVLLYFKLILLTVVAVGWSKLDLSAVLDPATRKEFRDVLQ